MCFDRKDIGGGPQTSEGDHKDPLPPPLRLSWVVGVLYVAWLSLCSRVSTFLQLYEWGYVHFAQKSY